MEENCTSLVSDSNKIRAGLVSDPYLLPIISLYSPNLSRTYSVSSPYIRPTYPVLTPYILRIRFSLKTAITTIFDQYRPKRPFPAKSGQSGHHFWIPLLLHRILVMSIDSMHAKVNRRCLKTFRKNSKPRKQNPMTKQSASLQDVRSYQYRAETVSNPNTYRSALLPV